MLRKLYYSILPSSVNVVTSSQHVLLVLLLIRVESPVCICCQMGTTRSTATRLSAMRVPQRAVPSARYRSVLSIGRHDNVMSRLMLYSSVC